MSVLALDTSTPATTVALRLPGAEPREARDDPPAGAHPGHATRLLALARGLLQQEGVGWDAIGCIAVGVGPGTFTGLRVGVATARGLAQSLSARLVGVSSLDALALGAADARGAGEGVLAVLDARRGEVFAAAFGFSANGHPVALADPRALAPEALAELLLAAQGRAQETDEPGGGTADERSQAWLAIGDGALRYRAHVEAAGARVGAQESLHRVRAAAVCELSDAATPVALEKVLPDYRRLPDAELAFKGQG